MKDHIRVCTIRYTFNLKNIGSVNPLPSLTPAAFVCRFVDVRDVYNVGEIWDKRGGVECGVREA